MTELKIGALFGLPLVVGVLCVFGWGLANLASQPEPSRAAGASTQAGTQQRPASESKGIAAGRTSVGSAPAPTPAARAKVVAGLTTSGLTTSGHATRDSGGRRQSAVAVRSERGGIGLSYYAVMAGIGSRFDMERSDLADGRARYSGKTDDGLAILEVIGGKSDVSQASLIVAVPSDAPEQIAENAAILARFLANVMPGWDGAADWVNRATREALDSGEPVSRARQGRRISVTASSVGMVVVTVKKDRTEDADNGD